MVKFFVTGDLHFGKKYGRYPEIQDKLISSRFDSLEKMVHAAEKMNCDFFVITGDMFDSINAADSNAKRAVDILSSFNGNMLVLPGNHDYYTGDEPIWKRFEKAMGTTDHNITLLNEFRPYTFHTNEDTVMVYPAYCQSKHSKENNLRWIREASIDRNVINIGVAHGALQNITPDQKEEYFLMSETELEDIPMNAWFIGHTHIQYPRNLMTDRDIEGYRVFNAGTHEQIDLHNNTEGCCFIVSVDQSGKTYARKYLSGQVRFHDLTIAVEPDSDSALESALDAALQELDSNSIVRARFRGTVLPEEYSRKERIYEELTSRFMSHDTADFSELSEQISVEIIRAEYAETSFASRFLEELMDDSTELQMAYNLLQSCRDE